MLLESSKAHGRIRFVRELLRARDSRARRARLRTTDTVTLVAVATVVLLVSLPRLRDFALRENGNDARQLMRTLAELVGGSVQAAQGVAIRDLVQSDAQLERQLRDVEYLDDGALLRRHGYLFELVHERSGVLGLRAWPWRHGRTGLHSYVWRPGNGIFAHPNPLGAWAGESRPPLDAVESGAWRLLPPP